ncbi:MAG TPA: mechanosensitive ion channel family protein [Vitreimonas sp.]|nr:mechanosensitive ion channel family protein [Vitreimonas sp.]
MFSDTSVWEFWYANTQQNWTLALVTFVMTLVIAHIFHRFSIARLHHLAHHPHSRSKRFIGKLSRTYLWPLYIFLAVWLATYWLQVPLLAGEFLRHLATIVIAVYCFRVLQLISEYGLRQVFVRNTDSPDRYVIAEFIVKVSRVLIWIVAILVILQNLGFNVTALTSGLGIAGIAIGFALQNILEDFFAFFSIYFDKPFQVGDFIIIGKDMGIVTHVGVKSTRIQTLEGQELIFPNKKLTEERVNNYKHMTERRVVFQLTFTYDTSAAMLKKLPDLIGEILAKEEMIRCDRVHFKEITPNGYVYEIVYFVLHSDYNQYMDIQQRLNIEIVKMIHRQQVRLAHPTQQVIFEPSSDMTTAATTKNITKIATS